MDEDETVFAGTLSYARERIHCPGALRFGANYRPLVEALAAGNCVVAKPSELAPATAGALIDQDFDYLFFTGSVPVGRKIMEAASSHLTPLTLELGGKSPAFVDASANIPIAARRIAYGEFYGDNPADSGQYGRIINDRHFDRLQALLEGASVCFGGDSDRGKRYIGPSILNPVFWEDFLYKLRIVQKPRILILRPSVMKI